MPTEKKLTSLRAVGVVLAGLLLLAGCGSGSTDQPAAGSGPSSSGPSSSGPASSGPSSAGPASPGPSSAPPSRTAPSSAPAPTIDLAGDTVSGGRFDAKERLAGKPAVLWFWAPWCTVCRAEAPDVAAVAKEFEGRVTFVGVAGRGPVGDMRRFVSDTGTGGFEHVVDADGGLWSRFGVVQQPTFVLVGADGKTERVRASLDAGEIRAAAEKLTRA